MASLLLYFATAVAALFAALYFYLQNKYTYWQKRGVPGPQPKFGIGNLKRGKTKAAYPAEFMKDIYDKLKGKSPIAGMYFLFSPVALVTDLDLISSILIKDFSHFVNHGVYHNENVDPLTGNLFRLQDDRWRTLQN